MFGLGMPEILLILAIALIVIGPKKLPELAKTLGRAMGEFKRSAQDFKKSIDIETTVKDLEVEDPSADLKKVIKEANISAPSPEATADNKGDSNPHGPRQEMDPEQEPTVTSETATKPHKESK